MGIKKIISPFRTIAIPVKKSGIPKVIKELPVGPGVYIMKSKMGEVIYVGKASSLRKRVGSYFSRTADPKTASLIRNIGYVDCIKCENPEQALILEAALIKERRPKYNISLRDNKSYPYVEITEEEFPRVFISRPKANLVRSAKFETGEGVAFDRATKNRVLFGPYPHTKTLKSALALIRRIFPYRSCRRMPKNACLYLYLNLCPAPCVGKISLSAYRSNIGNIRRILTGQRRELVRGLTARMNKLSAEKKFEQAAYLRDKLLAIESLYKGKPKDHEIIALKEILGLSRLPLRIEAIDISSLGGNDCVGSVVVFKEGAPDKNNYRRFRIRAAKKIDDYGMIAEVVRRRYSRLTREGLTLPDLIIIDGGKGHLLRAHKELGLLGVAVPVIGIAKRNEEIWTVSGKKPLVIARSNPGLQLIQRARDEAHRFAHAYGLLRRRKRTIKK